MLRVLFFLILVFALAIGFSWLADRPGELTLLFGGYQYRVSLLVAAIMVVATVAAVMIAWWVVKGIWNSPHVVARYFRARRRDRGYQALSTGMIAAGAGDSELARRKKKDALKLLSSDQEPLILLLDAQASLLEGDHDAARAKFEGMLKDPELKLLGLRGLYLEARRLGENEAARHYAGQAVAEAPQLSWAADATLEQMSESGEWDAAIQLVERQKATRQIEREQLARRKAVLLTAKARETLDADPTAAKNAALEANRLSPDLVPATVTAAQALFQLGDLKRGTKILEAAWKKEPHPEIADAHVHARPGDSTHDRLARAKKLAALRPNHVESALVVARAAFEAGEFTEARKSIEAALRQEPREGTFLLLADVEEAETGEQGRVREWLARAVRAPRDPAWVADGYVSERWAPASPVTGRLDAFEWRSPVERLGRIVEAGESELPQIAVIPPARQMSPAVAEVEAAPAAVTTPGAEDAQRMPDPKGDGPVAEQATGGDVETPSEVSTGGKEPTSPSPEASKPVVAEAKVGGQVDAEPTDDEAVGTEEPRQPPIPDDPGVDPDEPMKREASRFRLF
ncbi:heme biosynthesis protein HemY [Chelativorans sp. ZYF759]|uniref:heme biosynthesis protein HemY n=1 Tax=Chelativorans sp. ZYF759 TaxID=2692213 RepID=UPI00145DFC5A|nr:heme biosynthesis protein HemY [Chelativorans sp. ZYF759]NMG38127.1 heme biosynthesis protein HemY [Chelativorans sp. ZYF759]